MAETECVEQNLRAFGNTSQNGKMYFVILIKIDPELSKDMNFPKHYGILVTPSRLNFLLSSAPNIVCISTCSNGLVLIS